MTHKTVKLFSILLSSIVSNANAENTNQNTQEEDRVSSVVNSADAQSCTKLRGKKLDECINRVVNELNSADANAAEWLIRKKTLDADQGPIDAMQEKKRSATIAGCRRKGYTEGAVYVGMTQFELYTCGPGMPEKINSTISGKTSWLQLVYENFGYVYIRNGVVTTIQTTQQIK